jgi:hypothetical protein
MMIRPFLAASAVLLIALGAPKRCELRAIMRQDYVST